MRKSLISKFILVSTLLSPVIFVAPLVLSSCTILANDKINESTEETNNSNQNPNETNQNPNNSDSITDESISPSPSEPIVPSTPNESTPIDESFFLTEEENNQRLYDIFSKLNWDDRTWLEFQGFLNAFDISKYNPRSYIQSTHQSREMFSMFLENFMNKNSKSTISGKDIIEKYIKYNIYNRNSNYLYNLLFSSSEYMQLIDQVDGSYNVSEYVKRLIINDIYSDARKMDNIIVDGQKIIDTLLGKSTSHYSAPNEIFKLKSIIPSNYKARIDVPFYDQISLNIKLVPTNSSRFNLFFNSQQVEISDPKGTGKKVKVLKIDKISIRHDINGNVPSGQKDSGIYSGDKRIVKFTENYSIENINSNNLYFPVIRDFDLGWNHDQRFLEFVIYYFEKHIKSKN